MKHTNTTRISAFILCVCMLITICGSFVSFSNLTAFAATIGQVHSWRLVGNGNTYIETSLNWLGQSNGGYIRFPTLDNKLSEQELLDYAKDIEANYKFSFCSYWFANTADFTPDGNDSYGAWYSCPIKSVTYDAQKSQAIGDNCYLFNIVPDTTHTFSWNDGSWPSSNGNGQFYVQVYCGGEPKKTFNNVRQWGMYENDERIGVGGWESGATMYEITDANAFNGDPDDYAEELLNKYKKIAIYSDDTNWSWADYDILDITYDEDKTNQKAAQSSTNVLVFKISVYDLFYWASNITGDDGERAVNCYIMVTEPDPDAPTPAPPSTPRPNTEPFDPDDKDDVLEIESHIINKQNHPTGFGGPIVNPAGVKVNLFDYWLEDDNGKPGGEYGTGNYDIHNYNGGTQKDANWFHVGMNDNHFLLFGGGNRFQGWKFDNNWSVDNPGVTNVVGAWNGYTGDGTTYSEASGKGGPRYGIVKNKLNENGYPVLNLSDPTWGAQIAGGKITNADKAPWSYYGADPEYYDGSKWTNIYHRKKGNETNDIDFDASNPAKDGHFTAFDDASKLNESLEYLFNPDAKTADGKEIPYRRVYEDVRGMFRLDRGGYYYYNAADIDSTKGREDAYGYLGTDPTPILDTDEDGKPILDENGEKSYYYNMTLYDVPYGTQFFPFDEWSKSFEKVRDENGEPIYDEKGRETVLSNGCEVSSDAIAPYAHNLNHYFGMTLETEFRQPLNGLVNKDHMQFDFSGDDDVWIFIDGVLVGDIGGVHSKIDINIDFATGKIETWDRAWDNYDTRHDHDITTLYKQFRAADPTLPAREDVVSGKVPVPKGWKMRTDDDGNNYLIFETGSVHELKFFYMERGHEESNLSLSYNFPDFWPGRVHKVDEDGKPLGDLDEDGNPVEAAKFNIYPAKYVGDKGTNINNEDVWNSEWYHKASEFEIEKEYDEESGEWKEVPISEPIIPHYQDGSKNSLMHYDEIVQLIENSNGEKEKVPLTYSQRFYIMREEVTPDGYRSNKDVVLEYQEKSGTLTIVNRYETGVYASFMAKWIGSVFTRSSDTVPFADYKPLPVEEDYPINPDTGKVEITSDPFPAILDDPEKVAHAKDLEEGLVIVVPTIRQLQNQSHVPSERKNEWFPMHGSNTDGWQTVTPAYATKAERDANAEIMKINLMTALITAAFIQASDDSTREWYLEWQKDMQRFEGFMENLPGNATRYLKINLASNDLNDGADLNLVPLFIPKDALVKIVYGGDESKFPTELTSEQIEKGFDTIDDALYEDLKNFIQSQSNWFEETEDGSRGAPIIDEIQAFLEAKYREGLGSIDILDMGSFGERQYRTVIYVPNERRELRIRKIDEKGNYINGAVFAIFDTSKEAYDFEKQYEESGFTSAKEAIEALEGSTALSYGKTDTMKIDGILTPQDGTLIFRGGSTQNLGVIDKEKPGISYIGWKSQRNADAATGAGDNIYWLKEIYAPVGYDRNEYLVRIEIGDAAVLANATAYEYIPEYVDENGVTVPGGPRVVDAGTDDGVTVRAALGKLAQTLTKFAIGNNVNVTLRDITIYKQTQNGGSNGQLDTTAWYEPSADNTTATPLPGESSPEHDPNSFNLHYGKNSAELTGQYGRHVLETDKLPIFEAEDGYIRVMPRQNVDFDYLRKHYIPEEHDPNTKYDHLVDENGNPFNLDGLFTLMNIVVVRNNTRPAILELSKEVKGNPNEGDSYQFGITLKGDADLPGIYAAYVHNTEHTVTVYDDEGNELGDRDCTHADNGHTYRYLYVDEKGKCHFIIDRDVGVTDEDGNILTDNLTDFITLKHGETYVILDLPQGTTFKINETIYSSEADEYKTSISVDKQLNPNSKYTISGLTVSDKLNSQSDLENVGGDGNTDEDENTEMEIPSVKVKYINSIHSDTDPELPDVGGAGTLIFFLLGSLIIAAAAGYLSFTDKRKTGKQT